MPKGTSRLQVQETPVTSKIDNKNVHVFVQQKGVLIEPYTKKDENIKVKLCDNARTNFSWKKLALQRSCSTLENSRFFLR